MAQWLEFWPVVPEGWGSSPRSGHVKNIVKVLTSVTCAAKCKCKCCQVQVQVLPCTSASAAVLASASAVMCKCKCCQVQVQVLSSAVVRTAECKHGSILYHLSVVCGWQDWKARLDGKTGRLNTVSTLDWNGGVCDARLQIMKEHNTGSVQILGSGLPRGVSS